MVDRKYLRRTGKFTPIKISDSREKYKEMASIFGPMKNHTMDNVICKEIILGDNNMMHGQGVFKWPDSREY